MTREQEQALIRRVLAGDPDQFQDLVRANERGVYNLALRMLGNEQDALDASQESFFRAWKNLASFRGDSRFSVWLYRLAGNVCLDMLRRAGRRSESSLTTEDGGELPLPDTGRHADPQDVLERRELQAAVRAGMDRLGPEFRQVLVLREIAGLSYDEIGQATGLEPGTVKSRIYRARQKLAAHLTAPGNIFGPEPSYTASASKKGGDRK